MRREIISFDKFTETRLEDKEARGLLKESIPLLGLREITQINSSEGKFHHMGATGYRKKWIIL